MMSKLNVVYMVIPSLREDIKTMKTLLVSNKVKTTKEYTSSSQTIEDAKSLLTSNYSLRQGLEKRLKKLAYLITIIESNNENEDKKCVC